MVRSRHIILVVIAVPVLVFGEQTRPTTKPPWAGPYTPPPSAALLEGWRLLGMERNEEGRAIAASVLAAAEATEGPDSTAAAQAIDLLVTARINLGDAGDPAILHLAERAAAIKEKVFGHDHAGTAWSLMIAGGARCSGGDRDGAMEPLRNALAIQEKVLGPDHPDVADTLTWLARCGRARGHREIDMPLLSRAASILERALGPEDRFTLFAKREFSTALVYAGEFAESLAIKQEVLAGQRKTLGEDHLDTAWTMKLLADTHRILGDDVESERLYRQVVAVCEKHGPAGGFLWASTLEDLSRVLLRRGDYASARTILDRSLAFFEMQPVPDPFSIGVARHRYAYTLARLGEREGAKPMFDFAIALLREHPGPNKVRLTEALTDFAGFLSETGEKDRAREVYAEAISTIEREAPPDSLYLMHPLDGLADLHLVGGDAMHARPFVERSLDLKRKHLGGDSLSTALSLKQLATVHWMTDRSEEALKNALRAEEIARDNLRLMAQYLIDREALSLAASRVSGLDLAISIAAAQGRPEVSSRAFDALIRSRAVVLDEVAARHQPGEDGGRPEVRALRVGLATSRRHLASLAARGPGEEPSEHYSKVIATAVEEKEKIERDLAAVSAAFRQEQAMAGIGLEEVRRALPPETALVAFARYVEIPRSGPGGAGGKPPAGAGASSYAVFILKAGAEAPMVAPLGAAAEIDSLVGVWLKEAGTEPSLLPSARSADESRYRDIAGSLRRMIWDPIEARLRKVRQVFLVGDGAVLFANIATLPSKNDRFLAEDGPVIHHLSAERDLARMESAAPTGAGVLVMGGPEYDVSPSAIPSVGAMAAAGAISDGLAARKPSLYRGPRAACDALPSMTFAPLPGASAEAVEIATLWRRRSREDGDGPPLLLTGERASEEVFKTLAPGRRLVHLATHAFSASDICRTPERTAPGGGGGSGARGSDPMAAENPLLLAGLALAGANRREKVDPNGDRDDGILTAEEIASVDLRGVNWVVLSGCRTALGEVRAGEGIVGLRRAFAMAGARTLIMSLWKVSDGATRSWMERLYESRLSGLSTVDSMRKAARDTLKARRRTGLSDHPFYWGAFVAVGDWR